VIPDSSAQLLRLIESSMKCDKWMNSVGLDGRIRYSWHIKTTVPWCAFVMPDKLVVRVDNIGTRSIADVDSAVLDNMTSCALYRKYCHEQFVFRQAIIPSRRVKPVLHGFRSSHWVYVRNQMIKALE
jgi:hypothetical protein